MFVALDLPDAARAELAAWRDALVAGRDDLRPVRPEALHVTLVFLGWQDESAAEAIAEAAFGAVSVAAPLLRCGEVRPLPPRLAAPVRARPERRGRARLGAPGGGVAAPWSAGTRPRSGRSGRTSRSRA